MGLKSILEVWGADIVGPAATTGEALRLVSERAPDVALVDVSLRNGEKSYDLIDRLHEQGTHIVVISGYADVPLAKERWPRSFRSPCGGLLLASLCPARTE